MGTEETSKRKGPEPTRGRCPVCGGQFVVRPNGTMRWHLGLEYENFGRWRKMCAGVGQAVSQ